MAEFKPWIGHVPRDRGSIWYLAPLMSSVFFVVLVAFAVAVALG